MSMPPDSEVIGYYYADPADYENQFVPDEPDEQEPDEQD
jgi:hypothetical protein